jgi:hypothetical protein
MHALSATSNGVATQTSPAFRDPAMTDRAPTASHSSGGIGGAGLRKTQMVVLRMNLMRKGPIFMMPSSPEPGAGESG